MFTDLTPLVDALPYRQNVSPGHLRLATRNGRVYGMPYLADNSVLWYNTVHDWFAKYLKPNS